MSSVRNLSHQPADVCQQVADRDKIDEDQRTRELRAR